MITFIIPTMWKSEMIYETIKMFCDYEDSTIELIIIDNINSDYTNEDKRINIIKPKKNLFVNPSWNLGVTLANNDHVCLLNDDITFNLKLFLDKFKEVIKYNLKYGLIAINAEGFKFEDINDDNDIISLEPLNIKGAGFGMFMVMKRENYELITPKLKIFYGDDIQWLVQYSLLKNPNYYFKNLQFKGEFSVTSREYNNDGTSQIEDEIFQEEVNKLRDKYTK